MKNSSLGVEGPVNQPLDPQRIAFRIDDAANAVGLSRSTIYELINAGKLRSVKAAGRRLILADDLKAFLLTCEEAA